MLKNNKGSFSLIMATLLSMMCIASLALYLSVASASFTAGYVITRTDAVAESAAVYGQSYDYKYNKAQTEIMANMLTEYNNGVVEGAFSTSTLFDGDSVMTITGRLIKPAFYPELIGNNYLTRESKTTIKAVDPYGDVFVVTGTGGA